MITTYKAASDIDVLTTNFPIPGLGQLAPNSFVLHGDVPVLVDTGPVVERESFMTALQSVIDPATSVGFYSPIPTATTLVHWASYSPSTPTSRSSPRSGVSAS